MATVPRWVGKWQVLSRLLQAAERPILPLSKPGWLNGEPAPGALSTTRTRRLELLAVESGDAVHRRLGGISDGC